LIIMPGIFGIDIDDVICQTNPLILRLLKEFYGVDIRWEWLTSYYFARTKGFPLTQEQVDRAYGEFTAGASLAAEPLAGAREALLSLRAAGHRLCLITARPESMKGDTEKWLAEYGIPYDELIFSGRKHLIEKIGYWVEDKGSQAKLLAESGKPVFLMDYPWNRRTRRHPNIRRVRNWAEIMDLLRFFAIIK